jgi:hypothetical protein
MDSLKEDVGVDSVECLGDVEEQDRTLLSLPIRGGLLHPSLKAGEEEVDSVSGAAFLAEAELSGTEVVSLVKFSDEATMNEVFECTDEDRRH